MEGNDLVFIQEQIGYMFSNPDLLQQAFIRRSYSAENGGENNEVLEFIGDKVLDFIVVKLLSEKYGYMLNECAEYSEDDDFDEFACDKDESELTEIKKTLVQKATLSKRIDTLELADYLIMGKGDIQRKAYSEASVKEDLFEAILGAVAIDSNWDISQIQSTVEIMLDPDSLLCDENSVNYVSLIYEWFAKEYHCAPEFKYDHSSYYDETSMLRHANEIRAKIKRDPTLSVINVQTYYQSHYKCWISLFDKTFIGYGTSKNLARKDLCELIYSYLEDHGLLFSIRDEIHNPNKDDAINQLEILARRGYFSIPTYDFEQAYDQNGNPVWKSICHIAEKKKTFSAISSSKKDAKKTAAYQMLQFVLGE